MLWCAEFDTVSPLLVNISLRLCFVSLNWLTAACGWLPKPNKIPRFAQAAAGNLAFVNNDPRKFYGADLVPAEF